MEKSIIDYDELKIIEISIKTEKDIENLFSDGFLSENLNKRIGNKIIATTTPIPSSP